MGASQVPSQILGRGHQNETRDPPQNCAPYRWTPFNATVQLPSDMEQGHSGYFFSPGHIGWWPDV
jgi:hypothetical protein